MNFLKYFAHTHWWGKLLGAFFGFLLAGPIGALFGIFIGNFFDRGIQEIFKNPFWQYYAERKKETQKIFFRATFAVMGYIAKADGYISEQEIKIAENLMSEMRLSKNQKFNAKKFFSEGKTSTFDLNHVLNLLAHFCANNSSLLKLFIDIQYRAVMSADLSSEKLIALDRVFKHLGFAPLSQQYRFYTDFSSFNRQANSQNQYYEQQNYSKTSNNSPHNALTHAYAILQINPKASKQEVKIAYRKLISKNHPDKLIAKGLPEEQIKIATDKTQQIRKAYEEICASKGW